MLFTEMSDNELRAAYRAERNMLYGQARIGSLPQRVVGHRAARNNARNTAETLKRVEMIERIADKRGIRLT